MEEKTLKQFTEEMLKNPVMFIKGHTFNLAEKLLELESIENWLIAMYGIELDIKVRPIEKKEGRFYGKGLVDMIN